MRVVTRNSVDIKGYGHILAFMLKDVLMPRWNDFAINKSVIDYDIIRDLIRTL